MTRVLLVGKGPPDGGGIATFLHTLLHSDLAVRHDLVFLNVARKGTTAGGRFTAGNIARTTADTWAVWQQSKHVDVVHIHSALAPLSTVVRAGLLAAVARARRRAVIVHAHGGRLQLWAQARWRRAVLRVALAPAHRVVAVSRPAQRVLASALSRCVELIDNGVDVSTFAGQPAAHDPPRVLYAGLLTPRKGLLELLEASRLLRERGIAHEVRIAGGTPDEGESAEAQVRRAAGPEVRFLGRQPYDAMPALYREADVFCLPSWWEAMPLSVLEAMAASLPVVASSVGDVPELVEDGVTGTLVPPKDAERLAAALGELLQDVTRRRAMGAAGRARVAARFSLVSTVHAIGELYEQLPHSRR